MKLWLLEIVPHPPKDLWDNPYDKAYGFVIRAETETEARQMAHMREVTNPTTWTNPG